MRQNIAPEDDLKQLLLQSELDLLARLEQDTARLVRRFGDDAAVCRTLQPRISEILQQAGLTDHARLSAALAPLLVQTLKAEIRNSRDMMVDALYPITGRLVAAAVKNAFKDLVDQINARMDQTLSVERWMLKFRARATGTTEAELLLQKYPPWKMEDLYLIHRPSGRLILCAGNASAEPNQDGDVVAAMLSAILSFCRDTFKQDDASELRRLEFDGGDLFVCASPAILLVAHGKGTPPAGFETSLQEEFVGFLDVWGLKLAAYEGDLKPEDSAKVQADVEKIFENLSAISATNGKKKSGKLLWILLLIAGIAGYFIYSHVTEEIRIGKVQDAAAQTLAGTPGLAGYPVTAQYDGDANRLQLSGLLPSGAVQQDLAQRLARALPDIPIDWKIGVLPEVKRIDEAKLVQRLRQEIKLPEIPPTPPVRLLRDWTDGNSVVFETGTKIADEANVRLRLAHLVTLLAATGAETRLRIAGFTDSHGAAAANLSLSRKRAETVARILIDLGVSPGRLSIVGRGTEKAVTQDETQLYQNRRVEFEVIYPGQVWSVGRD